MPGDICPEGLQVAPGPSGRDEASDRTRSRKPAPELGEEPKKRASLPSAGMRDRLVADAGSGGSPCPAGRDDAVSEARANTACLDLHVPRLGEEPIKEGPHGAGLLPGVPRADYQIRTRWSSGRTIGSTGRAHV